MLAALPGCFSEDLTEEDLCHPTDPACSHLDADGDGIPNGEDDFPVDAACSVRNDANCLACGEGCPNPQFCDAQGACVCPDEMFVGEGCLTCADPLFTGPSCSSCANPRYGRLLGI